MINSWRMSSDGERFSWDPFSNPSCDRTSVEKKRVIVCLAKRGWDHVPHCGRSGKPVGAGSALHPPPAARTQCAPVAVRVKYECSYGF
ncbi:hypothetical protein AVEN_180845-1 [Araneus ventricosus]|uniref:Uncharacterized protein n=1 Tax=Araneus ventricosus TaxID=182803 RepID=A0A4Y2HAY7_ARAVE|nr:hypothetical protein AVEN_180845-1 [Araneus ventricosus]